MSVSALRANYPSLMFLGASGTQWGSLSLPLPLDTLGMPGNVLEASTDLAIPFTLMQSGNTYVGSLQLAIPAGSQSLGLKIYSQALFLDPKANKFGAALSQGMVVYVQSASNSMQYLYHKDSTSKTGSMGNQGEALVVQFEGAIL